MIEQLIAKVFATRNAVHLAHWSTKSFAKHSALGDLYDALIVDIDSLVEAYQGVFPLVEVGSFENPNVLDILAHLESDLVWIANNRASITRKIPALDNLLQTLESTYMSAIYKLRHLS